MKDNKNNQIAKKLESLDTLPEGYYPDLESKWALLEDAMEEKAVVGWYSHSKWITVAASILLLFTTGLWLHFKYRENEVLVKNNSSGKQQYTLPVKNNNEASAYPPEKIASATAVFKKTIKTEKQIEKRGQRRNNILYPHPNEKAEPLNIAQSAEETEDGEQQKNNMAVDPQPIITPEIVRVKVTGKMKRQRYVAMDFNEPNKIIPQVHEERIFSQLFQLKIFPDPDEPIIATNSESNFLKIKKKF